jgi:predicted N-acetyltransferase YhbS
MGKFFSLSKKPSSFGRTLELIENSFAYKKPFSFQVDFAPLMDQSNHQNCFISVDENDSVLAHIGVKEKTIKLKDKKFTICLLGGIAVDEKRRGEGIFQELLNEVLSEKRSDTTFFLLWSNLEKLYNKFGFHLCGTQLEVSANRVPSTFIKTTYSQLLDEEKEQIQDLFTHSFAKIYLTLERSVDDWKQIEKISSADLFVRKDSGRIQSYYFQNKGQDLSDVIYEYGTKEPLDQFLREISSFGKLWVGKNFIETDNLQYQFFMCPGDLHLFKDFIASYTNDLFRVRNINFMKQEVFFDFNDETLSLDLPEFLQGVFGPGVFEEIETQALFISGLDSI